MKSPLPHLTALLLLCFGFTSTSKAEVTESNLTFQIKVYHPLPLKGDDNWTQTYQVMTYKTGDIAQKLAAKKGYNISNKAQIILRMLQTDALNSSRYLVRDKVQGDIPVDFPDITLTASNEVYKAKGSESKNTSSFTTLSNGENIVTLGVNDIFSHSGSLKSAGRRIISKEKEERRLFLISHNFSGGGSYKTTSGGVVKDLYSTAVIKLSPPKVLPTPLE